MGSIRGRFGVDSGSIRDRFGVDAGSIAKNLYYKNQFFGNHFLLLYCTSKITLGGMSKALSKGIVQDLSLLCLSIVQESAVSAQNKGFGDLPSSRIDSHRNFGSIGLVHVDFRPFPTRFMPKSTGNRPEHLGGGPFLVSLGCQMTRPPWVGDHFWCP